MEQKDLRELEHRCIQEEAPECTATCPIHVDARGFIRHVRNQSWDEAWKVLRKTMPFPGILGRICDAPCRDRCKRGEVDEPIEIGLLERMCVNRPAPRLVLPPIPKKQKRVAVFGGGMSSLTVCWDLGRKGYPVTLVVAGDALGGSLRSLDPALLPPDVIDAETEVLKKVGVTVERNGPALTRAVLDQYREAFDAVYIGLDAVSAGDAGLPTDENGVVAIAPRRQTIGIQGGFPKLWAGGCSRESATSPVWQAGEGRWAATSIDRYLQNVSATAGREKDGPYKTRLFTSTEGVETSPAVKPEDPANGYTEAEALAEAGRCLLCECLECVKVCPYLAHYGAYPKRYAREIYNNESIVMGVRQANKMINSCSLCGLCERVCPEDFAMQDLCLTTRQSMVNRGTMPPSAHEFALLDMAFSKSDAFALARHAPDDLEGAGESAHLFFPGCQICASSPDKVFQVYEHLRNNLDGGVGLMLDCCSAPALWSGRDADFQEGIRAWAERWREMGEPRMIVACSTCYRVLSDHLPEIPVVSLWQVLDPSGAATEKTGQGKRLAVHDPCTTRYAADIREAVRKHLKASGVDVEELRLSGELTECCGFGGLMQNANPEIAKETVRRRAELSESDYLTYCGMCRDNLAGAGKRVVHLLDILFPDPETPDMYRAYRFDDPAGRKRPGWSERRENRARLKARFLREVWNETPPEPDDHEKIAVRIAPEVRERLEARRILDGDIKKVLLHAQRTGKAFIHKDTGHYKACFTPYNVTFWVEYTESDGVYEIHNAYCHRMEVLTS